MAIKASRLSSHLRHRAARVVYTIKAIWVVVTAQMAPVIVAFKSSRLSRLAQLKGHLRHQAARAVYAIWGMITAKAAKAAKAAIVVVANKGH